MLFMKVLLCIDNNLQYDTRIKRHIMAIAEKVEEVHVLARAIPDKSIHIHAPNIKITFVRTSQKQLLKSKCFYKLAKKYGLYDELKSIYPLLDQAFGIQDEMILEYFNWLSSILKGGRWKEICERKSERMTLYEAHEYIVSFLNNSIEMAIQASWICADVIICNDIDTLLCGVLHKKINHSRIIYDIHDITCDISPGMFPLEYCQMLMLYEKTFIKYANIIMGVGDYLLKWVQFHYKITTLCIPIYSCNKKEDLKYILPKKYSDHVIRIYFHGLAFEARNLDKIVYAAKNYEQIHLIFRCIDNLYLDKIKRLVLKLGMQDRVKFLSMVETNQILKSCNQDGDIGIYASKATGCVNWAASFTNKFMEYLGAALPVITTDSEDQANIVRKYNCGFVLKDDSVDSIEEIYREILSKRKLLSKFSKNAWQVSKDIFDWDIYKERLLDIVFNNEIRLEEYSIGKLTGEQLQQIQDWEEEDQNNFVPFSINIKCIVTKFVKIKCKKYLYFDSIYDLISDFVYHICLISLFLIINKTCILSEIGIKNMYIKILFFCSILFFLKSSIFCCVKFIYKFIRKIGRKV